MKMSGSRFRSEEKMELLSKLREKELSLSMQGRAVEQIMDKLDKAFETHETSRLNDSRLKSSYHLDLDEVSYDGYNDDVSPEEDISDAQRQLQIIRENRALAIQRRIIEHNEALKNMEHMRQLAIEKARKEATDEMTARFFFTRRATAALKLLRLMTQRGDRAYLASEKGRLMLMGKAILAIARRGAVLSHMRDAAVTADMKLRIDALVNSLRLLMTNKLRSLLIKRANQKARKTILNKHFMKLFLFKERQVRYFICAARSRRQVLLKTMQSLRDHSAQSSHAVLAYTRAAKYHAVRRVKQQLKTRLRARILDTKQKLVADLYRTRKYFLRFLSRLRQRILRRHRDRALVLRFHRIVVLQKAFHILRTRLRRSAARRLIVKQHRSRHVLMGASLALQRLWEHAQRAIRARQVRERDYRERGAQLLGALVARVRERREFIANMKSGITYYYLRSVSHMLHLWKNYTSTALHFEHRDLRLPRIHLRRTASKCLQSWLGFCAMARERRAEQSIQRRLLNLRPLRRGMQAWIGFTQYCIDGKSRMIISQYHQTALRNSSKSFFFKYLREQVVNRQNYHMAQVFEFSRKCVGVFREVSEYVQEQKTNRHNYRMAAAFEYNRKVGGALSVWIAHMQDAVALMYLKNIKLGCALERAYLKRWLWAMQEHNERRAYLREVDEHYNRRQVKAAFQFLLAEHQRKVEETEFIRAFRKRVLWPLWQRRFFQEMRDRKQRRLVLLHDPRRTTHQVRLSLRHWHHVARQWAVQQRRARAAVIHLRSKHSPAFLHLIRRTDYCREAKRLHRRALRHRKRVAWAWWCLRIERRLLISKMQSVRSTFASRVVKHRKGMLWTWWHERIDSRLQVRKMQRRRSVIAFNRHSQLHRYLDFMYRHSKHMKIYRVLNKSALSRRRQWLLHWAFRGLKRDFLASQRQLQAPIKHYDQVILRAAMEEFRYRVLHRRMRRNAREYGRLGRLRALFNDWGFGFLTRIAVRSSLSRSVLHHRHRILVHCLHHWIHRVDERRRLKRKEKQESLRRRSSMGGRRDSLTSRRDSMSSVSSAALPGFKHSRCTMTNPYDAVNCQRAMKYLHHYCTLHRYFRRIMRNVTNTHRDFVTRSAFRHWRERITYTRNMRRLNREVHQFTHRIRVNDVLPTLMSLVESRKAERAGKLHYIDRLVRSAWKTLKRRANIGMKRVKHKIMRSRQSISFAEPLTQQQQEEVAGESIYARRRHSSFKMAPGELQQLMDQQQRQEGEEDSANGDVRDQLNPSSSDLDLRDLVIETTNQSSNFLDKLFPSVTSVKSDISVTSEVAGFGEVEYYEVQVGDFRITKQRQWLKEADRNRIRSMKRRFFTRLSEMTHWTSHLRWVIKTQRIERYRRMLRRLGSYAVKTHTKRVNMRRAHALRLFLSFKRFVYQIVEIREDNRSIRRKIRKMLTLRWNAWLWHVMQLKAARKVQEFVRANVDYSNIARAFREWVQVTEEDRKSEHFYLRSLRARKVDYFSGLFFHCQQSRRQRAVMVRAVKYHTTLVKKDALREMLMTYRKRLVVRKKVVVGLTYLRRNLLLWVLRKLRRHSIARQRHRAMQDSLRREIKKKFFARAVKWTKMMVLKHVSKQLSSSAGELSLQEKRAKVIKTLRKMHIRSCKKHAVHNWRVFMKVQRRCYKQCMKASIHWMRYSVHRLFRKLLSYCRMRRLKRKNAVKLLMLQRKQTLRRVISRLDTNVMHRFARLEDHRLWLEGADKKALARGFLKILACSKWSRLRKSQQGPTKQHQQQAQ